MKKTIATLAATTVAVASVAFMGCSGEPDADPKATSDEGETDEGEDTGNMTPEQKKQAEKSGFTPEGKEAPKEDPNK